MAEDFSEYQKKSGSLLKWLVVIAIVIAVVWYLASKGIIDLSSLPFTIPGLG